VQVPNAINIRRILGGSPLRALDQMAYSGYFDCESLDSMATIVQRARGPGKGLVYYLASLYLQLGEAEKATEMVRSVGRASAEMKWFSMLMLHCQSLGLPCPRLGSVDQQCLDYLQQKYSGSIRLTQSNACGLENLVRARSGFAVIGNAPSATSSDEVAFSLSGECVSFCFNNYHCNPRIEGAAVVHVVTPSWRSAKQVPGEHLVITGNSIFHRRSKVWRRFADRPPYVGIHTAPRALWASLVNDLQASPSAGLLLLSWLESTFDVTDKQGLVAGFSTGAPERNHSYDREPASAAHNWRAEAQIRTDILEKMRAKTLSLRVIP